MSVKTVRRIAARLLGAGESRIKISPAGLKKAEEALTADDVRALIKEGVIWAERVKGVSRIRAKIRHAAKKKGRRSGSGSRKGTKYARMPKKELWKAKTRLQRKVLKELRDSNRLKEGVYRKAYMMIKGNAWRSKSAMLAYFEDAKWLKQPAKPKAGEEKRAEAPAVK